MKKVNLLFSLLAIFAISLVIYSCSKDHDPPPDHISNTGEIHISNRSVQSPLPNDEETVIVLGSQMNNPYTIPNMTLAYNNLYNTSISSLTATHQYVKFLPNEGDHLVLLDEWETEHLTPIFDFPLDYEITTHGDAYYDPAAPDSLYTFRYATIPVGMVFPNVPNTILVDLFLPPHSSYLTEQAYYQVNENYDGFTDRIENDPPGDGDPPLDPCNPGCGDFPCCKLPWYTCSSKPCIPILPPNCQPGDPNWPDCLDLDPPIGPDPFNPPPPPPPPGDDYCECSEYEVGQIVHTYIVKLNPGETCEDLEVDSNGLDIRCGGSDPPGTTGTNGNGTSGNGGPTNECGCPIPSNNRIPAGCVEVDDDDGDFEAVKKVMVITMDGLFRAHSRFTNEQGCWNVNKQYSKRRTWVWVKFKNDNAKIRAVRKWYFWKAAVVADDYVGYFKYRPFNNFLVQYDNDENDVENLARMYWGCAHTINADFEYREDTGGEGVIRPKTKLNYLLNDNDGSAGGAPMLQNSLFGSWPQFLTASTNMSSGVFGYLSLTLYPDITAGYGNRLIRNQDGTTGTAPRTRDNYKAILFHELGHASHHQLVGETYWTPYRNHIINNWLGGNGVYGSFGNFAAGSSPGRVALGEAIGSFTGNRYGGDRDGGEFRAFDNPFATDPENFIPRGLMFDLVDPVSPFDIIVDPNDGTSTEDIISGFTPAMIFQSLSPDVNNIRQFRDRLSALHLSSTPNTLTDHNTFIDVYDVFN